MAGKLTTLVRVYNLRFAVPLYRFFRQIYATSNIDSGYRPVYYKAAVNVQNGREI